MIIVDEKNLKKKFSIIKKSNYSVFSDFDRTITKAYYKGKKISSMSAAIRELDLLGEEFSERAFYYFKKYYPIEIDDSIEQSKKENLMQEWWEKLIALKIKYAFNKEVIKKAVFWEPLRIRPKTKELIEFLHKRNKDFIIVSASTMSDYAIKLFLERFSVFYDNIKIVTNRLVFDEKGFAISVKKPLITSENKYKIDFSLYNIDISKIESAIVIGDHLHDAEIASFLPDHKKIKVAFLNDNIEKRLPYYKKVFDVIITEDKDFSLLIDLLEKEL